MKDKSEIVRDWVHKARNDLKTARDELATPEPATDTVCFHFQQAVEKLLKAWLIWRGVAYKPVHNLEVLLSQCEQGDPEFAALRPAEALTPYAVDVRYGDDFYLPMAEETQEADQLARQVEAFVLARLASAGVDPLRRGS